MVVIVPRTVAMASTLISRSQIALTSRAVHNLQSTKSRWSPPARTFTSSLSRLRIADDFVNMIEADADRPQVGVANVHPTEGFTLTDGLKLPSPLLFINGVVFLWDVGPPNHENNSWEGWNLEKLRAFEVISPRPGKRGLFPPPAFKKYLNNLGIQVDVLDSRNASATYNLLSEEGRRVGAALYPLSPIDARTGKIWAR